MNWFSRKKAIPGTFRVTGATRVDGVGQLILNGMPQVRMHVAGIVQGEGVGPTAMRLDGHFGLDAIPQAGAVVPADITSVDPLKVRVNWSTPLPSNWRRHSAPRFPSMWMRAA